MTDSEESSIIIEEKLKEEAEWWGRAAYVDKLIDWSNRTEQLRPQRKIPLKPKNSLILKDNFLPPISETHKAKNERRATLLETRKPSFQRETGQFTDSTTTFFKDVSRSRYYTLYQHKESLHKSSLRTHDLSHTRSRLASVDHNKDMYADLKVEEKISWEKKLNMRKPKRIPEEIIPVKQIDKPCCISREVTLQAEKELTKLLKKQYKGSIPATSKDRSPNFKRTGKVSVHKNINGKRKFKFVKMNEEDRKLERDLTVYLEKRITQLQQKKNCRYCCLKCNRLSIIDKSLPKSAGLKDIPLLELLRPD